MKYRSRNQIVSEILTATESGTMTKTSIMYKAYLSYSQLREYLSTLTKRGLLLEGNTGYTITDKGTSWLKSYRSLSSVLSDEEMMG